MEGGCEEAWVVLSVFADALFKNIRPWSSAAIAKRTAFTKGGFLELAKSWRAVRALATRSAVTFRALLPMIDAEALVTIAMAEPVTAA
jgi:hypothetical protein